MTVGDFDCNLKRIKADGIAILHAEAINHAVVQIVKCFTVMIHAHDDSAAPRFNDGSGIEQVTAASEVASVRYINVAGVESNTPFAGVNIMVTTYTDGTTSTIKVVK